MSDCLRIQYIYDSIIILPILIHDKFIFRKGQDINIETHPELIKSYLQKINSESKKICQCAYCVEEFGFPHLRLAHEKEIHVDEDGIQLEIACDMCEEKLPTGEDFRRHARVVHRKKVYILAKNRQTVYCDECGKSFKVNTNALSFYRSQNVLCRSKLFEPAQ